MNFYIPDESAISLKAAGRLVREGKVCGKVIAHNATISSIEMKALMGNLSRVNGLKDLEACAENDVRLEYTGNPSISQDLNHVNCEFANSSKTSITTCNFVMARVSEALGVGVVFESPSPCIELDRVFEDGIMSLHLKEGLPTRVKRGHPGGWFFEKLCKTPFIKRCPLDLTAPLIHLKEIRWLVPFGGEVRHQLVFAMKLLFPVNTG